MNKTEIQSYPNHYLIYARRSTDDPNNQKNSIAYQKAEIIRFAKNNLLPVAPIDVPGFCAAGIIAERHTAFKENDLFTINEKGEYTYRIERPKFAQLGYLLRQHKFKGVIFLCYDRASRNENDDNILNKLQNIGIDIQYVQVNYENNSAGKFHRSIDAAASQQYSRLISDKVRTANKHLREQGVCIYNAPVGYINTGNSRERPIDPERGPIIKHLFELYTEQKYSVSDLARLANAQGFTMRATRRKRTREEMLTDEDNAIEKVARPITSSHVHKILRNRFYLGYIKDIDGTYIKSTSHEPLVDEKLFNEVQRLLASKRTSKHYSKKLSYAYRGLLRCTLCNRVYTPYIKKGFLYYRSRCAIGCQNGKPNINAVFIETAVGAALSKLYFTDPQKEELESKSESNSDVALMEKRREKELDTKARLMSKAKEDSTYLTENKLTLLKSGVYSPEDYLAEIDRLKRLFEKLFQEVTAQASITEALKSVIELSELLKRAVFYYFFAKPPEKEQIMNSVFTELYFDGKTLSYECKKGFAALKSYIWLQGGEDTRFSELLAMQPLINESIQKLNEVLSEIKQ